MASANDLSENGVREQALEYTLAANPLVGIRYKEIWDSAGKLFEQIAINPTLAAKHYMCYIGELGRIASGDCALGQAFCRSGLEGQRLLSQHCPELPRLLFGAKWLGR